MKQFILLALFAFAGTQLAAQESSPKLSKEKGFNAVKIGAHLTAIQTVLQKDTLDRKLSFEPNDDIFESSSAIYLVDLKKPGYSTFLGREIERIEVYITTEFSDDEKPIVWRIKIFFKKSTEADASGLFAKMFDAYGGAYPAMGIPREQDENITWYSELVMMSACSYSGEESAPDDHHFKVEFYSAVGG